MIGQLTIKPRNALLEKIGLSPKSGVVLWVRRIVTFILADFAWLFFRANSMKEAGVLLGKLFGGGWNVSLSATLGQMGLSLVPVLMTVLSILTLIMIDRLLTYDDLPDGSEVLTRRGSFVLFVWMILFAWAVLLSKDMTSTFIYFQF